MRIFKSGIFSQLVVGYVAFAAATVGAFIISVFVVIVLISQSPAGPFTSFDPKALASDPESVASQTVLGIGGWLEVLDENYQIRAVTGHKRDEVQGYTASELFQLLDAANETDEAALSAYRGYIDESRENGTVRYYLVKIPRDAVRIEQSIEISNTNINRQYFMLGSGLFITLFILNGLLMSAFLSKRIKRPLQALQIGMVALQNGTNKAPLDFKAQMEFEEIRDTFNLMSERLTEEKAEKEANEQNKNQLLLNLSHDIKTPIATIKAYASALEEGLVKPDDVPVYTRTIAAKADRVNRLTEDLFGLLHSEQAGRQLQTAPTDVAEFVRTLCAAYYDEIIQSGFDLHVDIPDTRVTVEADQALLRRAMENLLSNAVKYNTEGSWIGVSLKEDHMHVTITVSDDGSPIPHEEAVTLFTPFTRGDKARPSDGGSGLGLAIARHIVEKHRGTLTYHADDGRNHFDIRLPKAPTVANELEPVRQAFQ